MIERKVTDKPLFFEITIGESHGSNATEVVAVPKDGEHLDVQKLNMDNMPCTPPLKPATNSRKYYHLPFQEKKPCIHSNYFIQDTRRRHYDQNLLKCIADDFDERIDELKEISRISVMDYVAKFQEALQHLIDDCRSYLDSHKHETGQSGRTELDKCRRKLRLSDLEDIAKEVEAMLLECDKEFTSKQQLAPLLFKCKDVRKCLQILEHEPQPGLPDVVMWMKNENKEIAYTRIKAQSVLHSKVSDEQSNYAGRLQTVFLREPGRHGMEEKTIAKVDVLIWLGLRKHSDNILKLAPTGYEVNGDENTASTSNSPMPSFLLYKERHAAVLRAHVYQARNLFGSDESGLADPFARIIYSNHVSDTKVIKETLNPTWDQMLKITDILFWVNLEELVKNPPLVVIEFYDRDEGDDVNYIGKAIARPIMKLAHDKYERPMFPPVLQWYPIYCQGGRAGDLLAAFELLHVSGAKVEIPSDPEPIVSKTGVLTPVPDYIRPRMMRYRIEVLFWGIRDIKRAKMFSVNRPKAMVDCGYEVALIDGTKKRLVQSEVCHNARTNPNFHNPVAVFDVELPENELFIPPLTIRVIDCRSFNRYVLAGTHVVHTLGEFFRKPKENTQTDQIDANGPDTSERNGAKRKGISFGFERAANKKKKKRRNKSKKLKIKAETVYSKRDDFIRDWWGRYYASCDDVMDNTDDEDGPTSFFGGSSKRPSTTTMPRFKVYPTELENVPEFNGFTDFIQSFQLMKGKNISTEADSNNQYAGTFKGHINVWKYPLPEFIDPQNPQGTHHRLHTNKPIDVLVRIYCVKALNLSATDSNGRTDPYISVALGDQKVNDKDNYVSKNTSPEFGRVFELTGRLPFDNCLTVSVYDWDVVLSDDLIGETTIDIENRYFSKYRPTCGLQATYAPSGFMAWRDREKPSQILSHLCHNHDLMEPMYPEHGVCIVDGMRFKAKESVETPSGKSKPSNEPAALKALQNFHKISVGYPLVQEHIETRTLYNPDKPGIPQGQLQMWVDIFPTSGSSPGPPVEIKVRKPQGYELRVTVYNTRDVLRTEVNMLTGEKSSDIYVKGWLEGYRDDVQKTDVHYSSADGSGMFNWRFVFPFLYNQAEEKILTRKKASIFALDETEEKHACKLHLQVWDADFISSDDFIGELVLDLNRVPVPARSHRFCSLAMLRPTHAKLSLITNNVTRGWLPFSTTQGDEEEAIPILVGKVDVELELITEDDAKLKPAGKAHDGPCALTKPDRPQENLSKFMSPLKVVKLIITNHKMFIAKYTLITLTIVILVLFFYSMPGYSVKKLFSA